MSLSRHERQVWNELERVLADDLPYTHTGAIPPPSDSSERFLPPRLYRIMILMTALMVGLWLLIIGALAYLLPMALTGLVVICVAVDRLHRPAPVRAEGVEREGLDH